MKRITLLLIEVATLVGVGAFLVTTSRHATAREAAPIFVTKIPPDRLDLGLLPRTAPATHLRGNPAGA